ncbi:MAG TPA: hypothetical protein VMU77_04645, partial [Acidimicrobiales bacterium]|nr:hypothetical protein [Acidimicrobiales bacterium]
MRMFYGAPTSTPKSNLDIHELAARGFPGARPPHRGKSGNLLATGSSIAAVAVALTTISIGIASCGTSNAIPGRITVKAARSSVVVESNPFRIMISGSSGTPVLSEVTNQLPGPSILPLLTDPVPPGTNSQSSGQLYAPLSFLVGHVSIVQNQNQIWKGDLQQGTRSGIQYEARRVIARRSINGGDVLTVSTNDPTGRKLKVTVRAAGSDSINVSVLPEPSAGVVMMSDSFTSSTNEAFYGFGGRHNSLNQHGNVLDNWVSGENVPGLGAPGTPSGVLYPNGPTAAYYPQAEFVSSHNYGFLLDQPQLSWFRMDSDRPDAWSVAVDAQALDYYVSPGSASKAIAAQ